ncbi:MAG: hypothetical protein GXC72_02800 [Chitinophagaceae bacterium]|jgi:hypothetical protein|nr:hypothetical protein [Chitinophagaceae bacterium]
MSDPLFTLMAYSIAPAVFIGWARYKKMDPRFHPFVWIHTLGLLAEFISSFRIFYLSQDTAMNNNIYVLLEWILLVCLFCNWQTSAQKKKLYIGICIIISLVWVADTLVFGSIHQFTSIFRICYSFALASMAIDAIAASLIASKEKYYRNSRVIIGGAMVLYFTYKGILEILYALRLTGADSFGNTIFNIMGYINCIANILFAYAMWHIPSRKKIEFKNQDHTI